jgi:hypothetical protein
MAMGIKSLERKYGAEDYNYMTYKAMSRSLKGAESFGK